MPKKFKGENSKAAVAKARKADAKAAENARVEKEKEDEYWRDDNKHVAKKQQRKADKDKKRQEEQARKLEARQMLAEEEASLPDKAAAAKPSKMTRAEIQAMQERQKAEAERAQKKTERTEEPLEENPNIALARAAAEGQVEARSVEDAISALSVNEPAAVDKHPEKRVKAAYLAYEEINLPRLKAENPNMRLSQLKQMLKKDWTKSPDNPLNQRLANAKR